MKKLALFLASIFLLTSFASCGRRQEILNQIESEKAAESAAEESNVVTMGGGRETVAPEPDTQKPDVPVDTMRPDTPPETDPHSKYPTNAGYEYTGGINKGGDGYYAGVTSDELVERFDGSYGVSLTKHWNTPLGVYFQIQSNFSCYNKLTGNMTPLCPDPLCRHTDCIWGQNELNFLYVNETHIYFSAGNMTGAPTLYRCDSNRNHVESLGIALMATEKIHYAEGDKVYIQKLKYKSEEAADWAFTVLDCNTKELTTIYDKESVIVYAVTGGDTVWYRYDQDQTSLYKTDLHFSHSETILEGQPHSFLIANENYLLIGDQDLVADYLYQIDTGRKIDVPDGIVKSIYPAIDNKYLYYTKITTPEEIAVSPLKDYFAWEQTNDGFVYRPAEVAGDGRIWRMNLETGEEEMCAEISYNGIPVRINQIVADGDAFFISYITYEGFRNYYNQDFDLYNFMSSRKYMYVDTNNGTITLLNP